MTRPARLFRLDEDPSGLALSCDETGLALAGVALLRRTANGFEPRSPSELDVLLRHANAGRDTPLALPSSGLRTVAEALNRGDLAKAQMAAVFMRVPELDADSAVRLILADDTLAKTASYDPDQPRDGHGRWTAGGDAPTPYEQAAATLAQRGGAPPKPDEPAPKVDSPSGGRQPLSPSAPSGTGAAQPVAAAPSPKARGAHEPSFKPGGLSSHYESHGGPGVVSTGEGDPGGISYGSYQIKKANISDFIAHEGAKWPELQGKQPGSPELKAAWQAIAARDPQGFEAAQYAYISRTHYQPQVRQIQKATGVDISTHSHALQDVVWSTAVQHGPGPKDAIVVDAIHKAEASGLKPTDPGFDAAVINAVYNERGRAHANGTLAHFPHSSLRDQRHIAARFASERQRALAELAAERR